MSIRALDMKVIEKCEKLEKEFLEISEPDHDSTEFELHENRYSLCEEIKDLLRIVKTLGTKNTELTLMAEGAVQLAEKRGRELKTLRVKSYGSIGSLKLVRRLSECNMAHMNPTAMISYVREARRIVDG